ncbi:MAG: hypothetical protein IPP29_20780 [Bacteroidetes bacterium]|nr:hypothetical protein [Bacteroidota bacterium]
MAKPFKQPLGLMGGTYTVTMGDANGCTAIASSYNSNCKRTKHNRKPCKPNVYIGG